MKFWKTYLILLMFLVLETTTVNAAQLPLEITAEYSESQQEILITVMAKEPVIMNAFTCVVTYNMDVYKLYKGNDCVENGYGYVQTFQTAYKKDGMVLCNVNENQVLFSGVNAQTDIAYQGPIAQVSLLKYNPNITTNVNEDIGFEITALSLNGETIPIEEEEKKIPSVIQSVEQIVYDKEQMPEASAREKVSDQADEPDVPILSESAPVPPLASISGNSQKEDQQSPTSFSAVSEEARITSGGAALQSESTWKEKNTSKTTSQEGAQKPQENSYQWIWLVVVVSGCTLVACFIRLYAKKQKDTKSN